MKIALVTHRRLFLFEGIVLLSLIICLLERQAKFDILTVTAYRECDLIACLVAVLDLVKLLSGGDCLTGDADNDIARLDTCLLCGTVSGYVPDVYTHWYIQVAGVCLGNVNGRNTYLRSAFDVVEVDKVVDDDLRFIYGYRKTQSLNAG